MKKIYGLIVKDALIKLEEKKNNIDEILSLCTLDEIEEIIVNLKKDKKSCWEDVDKWYQDKKNSVLEFIKYINSSNYSDYYIDNNYSIDFLNSLRRLLGYEVRFYKKNDILDNIEFILDDNESRMDYIICKSIERQRDKNSRLRGYLNSNEEKKYQLFYQKKCLERGDNNLKKKINGEILSQKENLKVLSGLNDDEGFLIKDFDNNYFETKDQLSKLIISSGFTLDDVEKTDINDFFNE